MGKESHPPVPQKEPKEQNISYWIGEIHRLPRTAVEASFSRPVTPPSDPLSRFSGESLKAQFLKRQDPAGTMYNVAMHMRNFGGEPIVEMHPLMRNGIPCTAGARLNDVVSLIVASGIDLSDDAGQMNLVGFTDRIIRERPYEVQMRANTQFTDAAGRSWEMLTTASGAMGETGGALVTSMLRHPGDRHCVQIQLEYGDVTGFRTDPSSAYRSFTSQTVETILSRAAYAGYMQRQRFN